MMASQSWVLWYSIFPAMSFPGWAESYSSVGWMMLSLFVGTRDLDISYPHLYISHISTSTTSVMGDFVPLSEKNNLQT